MPERAELRIDLGITEYYEWRLDRIPLPDGRKGVVCYFRDISAQVRARKVIEESREALRESDRRKDEFLATLSHELRNPLAPLRHALDVLRMSGLRDPIATPLHEMMSRQVTQLSRLVDDLLETSRISRGTLELRKQPVDVATIIRNALETIEPVIRAAGHQLTVSLPDAPLWVDGDPLRLAQVVVNLLDNAAKYTNRGGQIAVLARPDRAGVLLAVRDNGTGIAPEALAHVFEMFHRGDRHSGRGGLGVGLTLARRLVELHGGVIEAHSDGPGRGSEFTVRLPVTPQHPVATESSPGLVAALSQAVTDRPRV
jgi:signal transduction histidine kinase